MALAQLAAAPLRSRTIVLMVQATSAAVSGLPSDHTAFGTVVNVHVRPWLDSFQLEAKSGSKSRLCKLYWMILG